MKRIIFVFVLVCVGIFYFVTDRNNFANDYYDAVNENFFSHDYLDEDKYIYSTFTVAQDKSNEVRDGVVNDIILGNIKLDDVVSDKINTLYKNAIDVEERNKVSILPLKKYIDIVMQSNNISELVNSVVLVENELGVDIFTRISVDSDFLDNSKVRVYLYPVTFAFGSSADYYASEDYMAYKAYIKRAIVRLLVEYGYSKSEARMISYEVISFYSDIGNSSKLSDSYEDVTSYYNVVDIEYLQGVYTNFDIVKYLTDRGFNEDEYSLVDANQYRKLNQYLTDEYLLLWKKVILVEILSSYAKYVDSNYYDIVVDLNNSLTGINEEIDYKEDAINLIGSVFSDDVDWLYDKKVIDDEKKTYFSELFFDIKEYFRKMLENNEWLTDDTKISALLKLDAMKVYVGMDEYDNKYSEYIDVSGDNLVSNIISINKSIYKLELDRLENNEKSKGLGMSEVNAYYNPMENAVYIPSSIVFLDSSDNSYYDRLGNIGMVIAHEVTHGFDYNGSLFDENGNMYNWWSDEDRANYTKLKNKVSSYYSKIEVLEGKNIDGDKTVNENIADMGALKVISGVAKEKGASDEELKEMYTSFASFWKCQVNDNYAKLLLLNDSHSPNKYRVNAVLAVTDNFYNVYDIYPWNDMYIKEIDRVSVWQKEYKFRKQKNLGWKIFLFFFVFLEIQKEMGKIF